MREQLKPALRLLVAFTVLCGVIYPLLMTGIAQMLFPWQAGGSLLYRHGCPVGSALVGQAFHAPGLFWGRPSATAPVPYNAAASSASNLGPTNPRLTASVRERIAALKAADPQNRLPIPVDLVTASGSGLDPHISPAAAEYQVSRVAQARGIVPDRLRELVARHTQGRWLGLLGEPRVNVVELNLELAQTHK